MNTHSVFVTHSLAQPDFREREREEGQKTSYNSIGLDSEERNLSRREIYRIHLAFTEFSKPLHGQLRTYIRDEYFGRASRRR